ncbi:glycosyltransferase 87 family protein [Kribbella sp. CA-293567]|uniref:glycosyltransferase 87 family protein n=1 Tax=Kribbella sp. CA-293567 TaxID=3002436 RepID=UPI0022DE2958|nr:glycosyltransferase 87 family protein [Kribbella sp. CA-293567]WBQ05828.1 glycosyltransferase 87 family protein [Kribbella sp. CA-293567]
MTTSPVLQPVRTRSLLPAFLLAAVAIVTLCVALWPPTATMSDLRVYFAAAKGFVDGEDIYTIHHQYPGMGLGFTYPPFAAMIMAPLAVGEQFARLLITLLSAISLLVAGWVTARAVRPHWSRDRALGAGLVCAAAGLALEPVSSTFGMGQINLILLALLMVDLLGHTPRRFRGVLIGVATGIKLTPGIFIVFLLVTRRFREAAVASAATAGTLLLGWLVVPGPTVEFWTKYIFDPGRPGPAHYISNQSLRGAIARLTGNSGITGPLWLLGALIIGSGGLLIARRLYDAGRSLDAVVATGITGLLVSPISWSNHWIWVLPAVAVVWSWATRSRALQVFAGVWTLVFAIGLPWKAPWAHDQEFHHTFPQALVGNSYTIAAIAFLVTGLVTLALKTEELG